MPRLLELKPRFVKYVPPVLEQGTLYISEEYGTAIHLCACGCGEKTVTPFDIGQRGWEYKRDEQFRVTLRPSIGNQNMDCRSHYWITENKVEWC